MKYYFVSVNFCYLSVKSLNTDNFNKVTDYSIHGR